MSKKNESSKFDVQKIQNSDFEKICDKAFSRRSLIGGGLKFGSGKLYTVILYIYHLTIKLKDIDILSLMVPIPIFSFKILVGINIVFN